MPSETGSKPADSRFFVLALGLLVGFVIGFILLLANLPVDQSAVDFRARPITNEGGERPPTNFEFYSVLADTDPGEAPAPAPASAPTADRGAATAADDALPVSRRVIEASARTDAGDAVPSARAPAGRPAESAAAARTGTADRAVPVRRPPPASAAPERRQAAATTSLAATSTAAAETYFLQAGRFHEAREAERMRASVLLLGLEAFIVTRPEADGSLTHRVRIGPFRNRDRLTEAKLRLRRGQVAYEIVRVTG